jgi:hypothetical protein
VLGAAGLWTAAAIEPQLFEEALRPYPHRQA